MEALGISEELSKRGAQEGDLIMIDVYDFSFSPGMKNPYIPPELLERDQLFLDGGGGGGGGSSRSSSSSKTRSKEEQQKEEEEEEVPWRPFAQGGFLDVDTEELVGFGDEEGWDLLEDDDFFDEEGEFVFEDDDEVWSA